MAIAANSRVYHLSDRNRVHPRKGTVQRVYTAGGTQYAVVKWDAEANPARHPVANLVEAT